MASGMTNTHVGSVLKKEFGAIAYTPPTTWYVGVSKTPIVAAGTGVSEPVGMGYARATITNATGSWTDGANGKSRKNVPTIEFARSTGDWGTVVAVGLFSAATGGTPLYYADLTASKIVQANDSLLIEPGELVIDIEPTLGS